MHPDAIIIGGGIHGCSIAMHLAMHGAQVAVYEKDHVAAHASGVNAGSVHHIARLTAELPLAELTLNMWQRIGELVDDDCGYRRVGHLKIAESEEDLALLHQVASSVHRNSAIREEFLDRTDLRRAEPELADHCVGGIYSPDCGYALPAASVQAFRRKAESLGVIFHESAPVSNIARRDGRWHVDVPSGTVTSPVVVNCAGAWGDRIAALVGEPVSLTPLALMLSVLGRLPRVMNTVIGLTHRLLSIKQFENGTVVIGGGYRGTPDLERGITHLNYARLGYNLKAAAETFPALERARVVRCWAGIEGRSPDGLPIIGPSACHEGLWHAFAFSTHGVFLGPAVGAVIAEWIRTGAPPVPMSGLAMARFQQSPS